MMAFQRRAQLMADSGEEPAFLAISVEPAISSGAVL